MTRQLKQSAPAGGSRGVFTKAVKESTISNNTDLVNLRVTLVILTVIPVSTVTTVLSITAVSTVTAVTCIAIINYYVILIRTVSY